jgi:ribonuclease BN (tRNA processing enzyme)
VKHLVCTHLLPGAAEQEIKTEAESTFRGQVSVGHDLMEIAI